ncbi:MAG: OmpH family outer membrane protein [Rikenellaceae bacterium]
MKKIFIAASFALLAVSCTAPQAQTATTTPSAQTTSSSSSDSSLAYVDMELVLTKSDIFNNEGVPLQKRSETAQREWSQKEQALQSEAAQLQQKYQNGLITSANAQKEQASIESRAQAFQTSTQKQIAELEEENVVFANRTQMMIKQAIESVNKDKRYKMIVNASALIDADTTLNISNIVLEELNNIYSKEKK